MDRALIKIFRDSRKTEETVHFNPCQEIVQNRSKAANMDASSIRSRVKLLETNFMKSIVKGVEMKKVLADGNDLCLLYDMLTGIAFTPEMGPPHEQLCNWPRQRTRLGDWTGVGTIAAISFGKAWPHLLIHPL